MTRLGRYVRDVLRRDWFEVVMTVLGVLFLALSALCVVAFAIVVFTFDDPAPDLPIGRGLLQVSKGYGLAVFGIGALVTFFVGWAFAGDAIRRRAKTLLGRRNRDEP